mgnify:CR=1 FL=1
MKRRKSKSSTSDDLLQDASKQRRSSCLRLLFYVVAFGVLTSCFLANLSNLLLWFNPDFEIVEMGTIPVDISVLFQTYDRNGNGVLELEEFEPLGHKVLSIKVDYDFNNVEIEDDDEVITLNAQFTPIDPASMTNNINGGITVNFFLLVSYFLSN